MNALHRGELVTFRLDGTALVRPDRNPLGLYLLGLCAVSGLVGLAGRSERGISLPVDHAWHALLVVGGLAGIAGAYWRDPLVGVLVVRAAMWPLGAGAGMYAAGLAYVGRWDIAVTVAVFAGCCVWRAVQIASLLAPKRYSPLHRKD